MLNNIRLQVMLFTVILSTILLDIVTAFISIMVILWVCIVLVMYIYIAPYCVCKYVGIYMYTIDGDEMEKIERWQLK